jgi:hypothetical protein
VSDDRMPAERVKSLEAICVLCGKRIEGAAEHIEVPDESDGFREAAVAGTFPVIRFGWFAHLACLQEVASPTFGKLELDYADIPPLDGTAS